MNVKILETHEKEQNKRVKKTEIWTVVKTGKVVLTHACDRIRQYSR